MVNEWAGGASGEAVGALFAELVGHSEGGSCEVSDAELLHILNGDLLVPVHVKHFKEGVDIFLLWVVGGVEDPVGVGEDGHGLRGGGGTFTGSMVPLRSLS